MIPTSADDQLVVLEEELEPSSTPTVSGALEPVGRQRRRTSRIGPTIVLVACALFFVLPMVATARFALQNVPMVNLGWSTVFDRWTLRPILDVLGEDQFRTTVVLSLKLAFLTVLFTQLLLLPTTLWVHLRLPKVRPLIEFLTVLPYVIPPIALVAGILVIKPSVPWFLNSDYSLIPFYAVLALPFTYRALDAGIGALDVKTLVDASRSLGAGWGTTLARVMIPNLRSAIVASSFLTATVVLGEYTIASVLLKETFPTFMAQYGEGHGQGGMALALLALLATTALLALLTILTRRRGVAAQSATVF